MTELMYARTMTPAARFVAVYVAAIAPPVLPEEIIPDEMLDPAHPTLDNWAVWRPIPSSATRAEVLAIEAELGIRLPEAIRDLLTHQHFLELLAPGIRFAPHAPGWREAIRARQRMELFDEGGEAIRSVSEQQLFVIGDDDNDGGPVCLDLTRRRADGDCPVVFVDHENGSRRLLFSSTEKMFQSYLALEEGGIEAFFASDPDGAGGPARTRWEHSLRRR